MVVIFSSEINFNEPLYSLPPYTVEYFETNSFTKYNIIPCFLLEKLNMENIDVYAGLSKQAWLASF
jgi:hypothetical protein